jgi:S-DNA-T family DNA segregation ATPase FtsK/SpoIIIE
MRVAIAVGGTRADVEVQQNSETATLENLVEVVCGPGLGAGRYWVDGREHEATTPLASVQLLEGSLVSDEPSPGIQRLDGWTVALSGGTNAGRVWPMPRDRPLTVGRSPQADVVVESASTSWSHATLLLVGDGVLVRDEGSTNGTTVDGEPVGDDGTLVTEEGVVVVGGAVLTLRIDAQETPAPAPGSLPNLTPAGTAPFNRPPRPGRRPAPDGVEPPVRKDDPPPARFSIATVAAPLLMAFAMVIIIGDPRFALFAAMSPVVAVGMWYEQRRRRRNEIAEEDERFAEALEAFVGSIGDVAGEERARRRDECPDPAVVLRRAALPTTRLWERRSTATDVLSLHLGVGDVPWSPDLEDQRSSRLHADVKERIAQASLRAAPVAAELGDAGVVGIVGDRGAALALARSLVCQAAVHVGPADLTIGVFCDQGRAEDWAWSSWLPHTRRHGGEEGGSWTSADRQRSETLLRGLADGLDGHVTPLVLLVLDSEVLTEGRDAPARRLLGHGRGTTERDRGRVPVRVAGVVVATSEESLPASCTTVVHVGEDADARVSHPEERAVVEDVLVAGLTAEAAARCARDLARFDDPELVVPGASLPGMVRLPALLGQGELDAAAISRAWGERARIGTPIGIGENGSFSLDLVRDGPHGLVGGTTGSGKSEFLRSFVAGLAARTDPTRLVFILVDFKGGAAFATCERLPHTIGTVSNLDAQLADRAIRSLEAELNRRQEVFKAAGEGIDNLDAYLATNPAEPMPRLLLVVDEFAMLAKDYPDVLKSLVSVAAIGRTLGVHMILATQRPAGVVNDDILTNTNLRVALRVQSREDSTNVVGIPDASAIGRTQWGRAYVKLGQDDVNVVQTALVTGRSASEVERALDVTEVTFGADRPRATVAAVSDDVPTDLDRLIDAVTAANDAAGFAPPRRVWPEALGERVELVLQSEDRPPVPPADPNLLLPPPVGGLDGPLVKVLLVDRPDDQRQVADGWRLDDGNLLVAGIPGSGTSTTLASVALSLADQLSPDELDLMVLDMGGRDLAPLRDLPHTVAYVGVGGGAREEQVRFLKHCRAELDRRRADPGPHRRLVVLIDGLAALKEEFDDADGLPLLEGLYRAWSDGPDVGISFASSTTRVKTVPTAIEEVTTQRWLFRLADPYDYSTSGVAVKDAPPPVPGRCVVAGSAVHGHVATPDSLVEAVGAVSRRWGTGATKAAVVRRLPSSLTLDELGAAGDLSREPRRLPVGLRESDFEPGFVEVYEGEHVMVAGPARSGKSTLLLQMGEAARRAAGHDVQVWGIGGRRSPLGTAGLDRFADLDDRAGLLASARVHRGDLVLLIDDSEQVEDSDQAISGLLAERTSGLVVVVAGRADELKTMYSHWTKSIRKSRVGVLLQPDIDYDGELLGARLPRRSPVPLTTGRGYLVSGGTVELVQCLGGGSTS